MAVDFSRNVFSILGLPFDALALSDVVTRVRDAAHLRQPFLLSTANLNFAVMAHEDAEFRHSILHSDLCVVDGMPIVWIARCLGVPIPERVSGADIFEALCAAPAPPVKAYFFGGPDGAAQAACLHVNENARGVVCVGFDSPGFGPLDGMSGAERIDAIRRSGAEFVVVSLGAKKGQAWIERNRARVDPCVISYLGAVVNFAAGSVERAPAWVRRSGFEWLWRIKEEPSLWRRYWNDAVAVGGMLVRDLLPLWWQQRHARGLRRAPEHGPIVRSSRRADVVRIEMSGVFRVEDLGPLRAIFTESTKTNADLELDLSAVRWVDSATIALIQLLAAHQVDVGRRLHLLGASKALRRQFRCYHVEALLSEPSVAAANLRAP